MALNPGVMVFPANYRILSVMWTTASGVSLSATASPGTTITSYNVDNTTIFAKYLILHASVTLYNSGSSAVNETIQVFVGSSYTNVHVITVPASGYEVVPIQYVWTWQNMPAPNTSVGLAGYGGSLTASYAYLLMYTVG
jgi:hypothetical protein